ncbi:MAG: hypothetical protein ABFD51_00605 [Anaerolineaceae bacterium]
MIHHRRKMLTVQVLSSLVLFTTLILTACSGQASPTPGQQSQTPITQTPLTAATQSAIPSQVTFNTQPTETPTATPYVESYTLKNVWIEFGNSQGGLAVYDFAFPVATPTWILYTDGTFISFRDDIFQTKKLTHNEICNLLGKIDQIGFYQIKTNGIFYEDDPIYGNAPSEKMWTDDSFEYLFVNGTTPKSLSVYRPIRDYAIQPVKWVMNSLRYYSPEDLQPYQPDRLALYIEKGRSYPGLEKLEAKPWPFEAISLSQKNENGALYLEGEMASRVFEVIERPYKWFIFTQKDQEYTVIARPLLPHERRTNYGAEEELTSPFEPSFTCK